MTHELKTWPNYFESVMQGDKPFEVRYNRDRNFQKGDKVILREYDPDKGYVEEHHYTGRNIEAEITLVTSFEQKEDYVVFGMKNIKEVTP